MHKEQLIAMNGINLDIKMNHFLDYYILLLNNYVASDRFAYANQYSSYDFPSVPLDDRRFPSFTNCLPLDDIMVKRAEEIYSRAKKENKKIVVSYSGGVDSTAIVCAFILIGVPKENLIILHSRSSIREFPWFYEFLVKNGYNTVQFNNKNLNILLEYYNKHHIFVTGNCGDMIFFCRYEYANKNDYRDVMRQNNFSDLAIQEAEDVLRYYHITATQACTVYWWLEYIIKYTMVLYMESLLFLPPLMPIVFYNDIMFDDWACCHMDNVYMKELTDEKYKPDQKAFIKKVIKTDCYDLKGKGFSWVNAKEDGDTPRKKFFSYYTTEGIKSNFEHNRQKVLDEFLKEIL